MSDEDKTIKIIDDDCILWKVTVLWLIPMIRTVTYVVVKRDALDMRQMLDWAESQPWDYWRGYGTPHIGPQDILIDGIEQFGLVDILSVE